MLDAANAIVPSTTITAIVRRSAAVATSPTSNTVCARTIRFDGYAPDAASGGPPASGARMTAAASIAIAPGSFSVDGQPSNPRPADVATATAKTTSPAASPIAQRRPDVSSPRCKIDRDRPEDPQPEHDRTVR